MSLRLWFGILNFVAIPSLLFVGAEFLVPDFIPDPLVVSSLLVFVPILAVSVALGVIYEIRGLAVRCPGCGEKNCIAPRFAAAGLHLDGLRALPEAVRSSEKALLVLLR